MSQRGRGSKGQGQGPGQGRGGRGNRGRGGGARGDQGQASSGRGTAPVLTPPLPSRGVFRGGGISGTPVWGGVAAHGRGSASIVAPTAQTPLMPVQTQPQPLVQQVRPSDVVEEKFQEMSVEDMKEKTLRETMIYRGLAFEGFTARPTKSGTLGRKIDIVANVYLAKFPATIIYHYNTVIYRYRVDSIRPDPKVTNVPRDRARQVWRCLEEEHSEVFGPTWGFDGRANAWTTKKLENGGDPWIVTIPRLNGEDMSKEPNQFTVKFFLAGQVDLQSLQNFVDQHPNARDVREEVAKAIQALDVVLKHEKSIRSNMVVGARGEKFFDPRGESDRSMALTKAAVILLGVFQSMRPTRAGMVLNLDSAYSPFLTSGRLLEIIGKIIGRPLDRNSTLTADQCKDLEKRLRNAKVRVTHRVTSDTNRITGFGRPAEAEMLSNTKRSRTPPATIAAAAAAAGQSIHMGGEVTPPISVAAFFRNKYNVHLKYMNLPCVRIGKRDVIPIECLDLLPGQPLSITAMTANDQGKMIKVTAKRPAERRRMIENIRGDPRLNNDPHLQAWNISIDNNMMGLRGRLLPPASVTYHPSSREARPKINNGSWNIVNSKVFEPGTRLERWGIVNFANTSSINKDEIDNFFNRLITKCHSCGLQVSECLSKKLGDRGSITKCLRDTCDKIINDAKRNPQKLPPQLIFIILDGSQRDLYDIIKYNAFFSLDRAVMTQVLMVDHVRKGGRENLNQIDSRSTDQYCSNVLLKLNIKLDGCNWVLSSLPVLDDKTMIVGADVTHPPQGTDRDEDKMPPSIAALVADKNINHTKFTAEVREQTGRQELIQDLKDMLTKLVEKRKTNVGRTPEKLIFYRDGVSEGQYSQVVEWEICQIRAVLPKVKLVYLICGKRHHQRFFAKNEHDSLVDKTGNLPAGLVVDDAITQPFIWDFYLQAHQGLQGTARPTHYVCLLDEIGLSNDDIQKLTNDLSYSYARATKAVSLVPVAYYADIVCEKARAFVYNVIAPQRDNDPLRIQKRLDSLSGMWWM